MIKFLKNNASNIYLVLFGIVLLGKVSNWFLNYSDQTNEILNTVMFCVIGIAYVAFSWGFKKAIPKLVFAICGIYVILMNFIPDFSWVPIIGIVCIVTPMIIRRFYAQDEDEVA